LPRTNFRVDIILLWLQKYSQKGAPVIEADGRGTFLFQVRVNYRFMLYCYPAPVSILANY